MPNFSKKERLIASLLSVTPGLKNFIKKTYIYVNAVVYRRGYRFKILDERIHEIKIPYGNESESFFGYYDKSPIGKNLVIGHLTSFPTLNLPSPDASISIAVTDIFNGQIDIIGESNSYTWQQGARTQWLDDDKLIFNVFDGAQYGAKVYSISSRKIVKTFPLPIQDTYKTDFFLSLNYQRIMRLRPDYGYRNLPLLSDDEMRDLQNDGIWKVEYDTGKSELLFSLQDIIAIGYKDIFDNCLHKVNHIMINDSGTGFIFIHRFYQGKRRLDRLVYSDFNSLRVLADDEMVSHCCWVDDNTVLGYLRHKGSDGYYYCDIKSGTITPCDAMTELQIGDGHPSCCGDWIAFDSYPDKSRMQHLYLYNRKTNSIVPLLQLYQSVKYMGECRCDLHPRLSSDARFVFFDSVYSGKRALCYIDVSKITCK